MKHFKILLIVCLETALFRIAVHRTANQKPPSVALFKEVSIVVCPAALQQPQKIANIVVKFHKFANLDGPLFEIADLDILLVKNLLELYENAPNPIKSPFIGSIMLKVY